MIEHFEKSTKPTFKSSKDRSFIRFGSMRDKDPDFGIRGGQITIEGSVVHDSSPALLLIMYTANNSLTSSSHRSLLSSTPSKSKKALLLAQLRCEISYNLSRYLHRPLT